ncbi:hypothetical protein AXG93_1054s1360 [Marchantia polymorpha subsp. ruderalis]|uniref:Uncharacterized protein n=1 Tax=Marchantia polymorpha subsp. ruderalis TaxID=1480154 RepID=A0A176WP09_MARPO|nr:hypothetical protein AXG93_1054s1360 [Marchantia polymorpha subsp. ruderalis]
MRATGHPHSPLLKEGLYFAAADAASEHDQELKSPERIPPVDRTSAPDYPPPSHARKETGSQELLIQDDSQQFLYLPDAIIGPRDQRLRLRPFLNLNPNGSQSPPSGRKPAPMPCHFHTFTLGWLDYFLLSRREFASASDSASSATFCPSYSSCSSGPSTFTEKSDELHSVSRLRWASRSANQWQRAGPTVKTSASTFGAPSTLDPENSLVGAGGREGGRECETGENSTQGEEECEHDSVIVVDWSRGAGKSRCWRRRAAVRKLAPGDGSPASRDGLRRHGILSSPAYWRELHRNKLEAPRALMCP